MPFEDNYTRRRVYVSRRQKQRKRQHAVRLILFFLILGIILAVVLICGLIYKYKKEERSKISLPDEPQSITLNPEPESDGPPPTEPETLAVSELDSLLQEAKALADTYDYDKAIALLTENETYGSDPAVLDAIASYEEIKSTLVRADINTITHVFFHSLIMDNQKAFDGDSDEKGYNQVMTTKNEFLKILEQMYERGYVLVRIHDLAHEVTDENGNTKMEAGDIMLPPGKKPFVMSQDDVCYYE